MAFVAKHRFARIAPRKARLIMDLVRGRDVDDAISMLKFAKQRASGMVEKVIRSAVANANERDVAPRGTLTSRVDTLLAERGLKRRVARTVGTFLAAPFLVAQSDYVVTMSARIAESLAPLLHLRVLESPVPNEYTLTQIWHRRLHSDPAHAWFRGLTARTASELPRLGPSPA